MSSAFPLGVARGLAAGLLSGLLATSAVAAAGETALSVRGIARDPLGNVLEGVEVIVLSPRAGPAPVAAVRTDERGRYEVGDLAAGVYRVTAAKEGYRTFLGLADSLLRPTLDLLLRPLPGPADPEAGPLPADASWTLRLPARRLLRETEAQAPLWPDQEEGTAYSRSGLQEVLRGHVEHRVDLGVGLPGASEDDREVRGEETRMQLASSLGERGRIQVRGGRRSLEGTGADGSATASQDDGGLFVRVSYETGSEARLDAKAFYAEGDLELDSGGVADGPELRRARRSWGYGATWSRQLDAASRLGVQFDYVDGSLLRADEEAGGTLEPGPAGADLFTRMIGAGGSYQMVPALGHELRLGVRARLLESPGPDLWAASDERLPGWTGPPGWAVGLRAEDAWAIRGPLTLLYGLGFERALGEERSSLLVPRVGGTWSAEGLNLKLIFFYHAVSGLRAGEGLEKAVAPEEPLGYEARVEAPLPLNIRVRGALLNAAPTEGGEAGFLPGEETGWPLLGAEGGRAGSRLAALAVERQFGAARTYLQFSRGTAGGTLVPSPSLEVPVELLADRRVRYQAGRVGVRLFPSGTDVVAEYRRVQEIGIADPAGLVQEYVEMQVAQELLTHWRGASWRLLLGARTGLGREGSGPWPGSTESNTLNLLNRRVSAGLSVAF